MAEHNDFQYVGTFDGETGKRIDGGHATTTKTALGTPAAGNVAQPIMDAAALAYRIRSQNPDPKTWAVLIDEAPADIRERVRQMLRDYFEKERDRLRREKLGKRSATGDAEMEKMRELARRL